MIAQRWTAWFARFGARRGAMVAPAPFGHPARDRSVVMQSVDVGEVPVFDHRHQQVGFIPAPANVADGVEVTAAQWMSHCMNDPVSWTAQAIDDGEISRRVGALGQRVPLVNESHQIRGIVVLEAPVRPVRQRLSPSQAAFHLWR